MDDSLGSTLLLLLLLLHLPLEQHDFWGRFSSTLDTSGAAATFLLLLLVQHLLQLPVRQHDADFFTASTRLVLAPIIMVQVPVEQHDLGHGTVPLQQAGLIMIRMAAVTRSDSGSNKLVKEKGRGDTWKKWTRTPFFLLLLLRPDDNDDDIVVVVVNFAVGRDDDKVRFPIQVNEPWIISVEGSSVPPPPPPLPQSLQLAGCSKCNSSVNVLCTR
jgi:hypothetical protein